MQKAPKITSETKEETKTISKETARRNIAQWLFVHAEEADSPAWRESLLEMIDWNIKHIK